ncbi:MAG: RagB/SusD family nutrient uptake outer membrane protein [Saprospiraceae bacterium]|nr:RagB/SusD family nutrient uptake outer membrane protein [Saprospiraceae bacterium]
MQRNNIAYLAILFLLSTACQKEFLEEEVFTFQAPKDYYASAAEVEAAANGMYDALMTWNLWVQPSWVAIALENDDMLGLDWVAGGYNGNQNGQWYIERPWKGFYQVINRANNVLDRVSKIEFLAEEQQQAVLGQAYFLRGYCYYEIARWFGDAPIRTQSFDPAVDDQNAARMPVAEVYAQAASDLETAGGLLPENYDTGAYSDADRGRPTSPAAWGLLTKVYMHMAGAEVGQTERFKDASTAAQKVLAQSSNGFPILETEYMANFWQATQDQGSELLFSIQATQQPNEGPELPRYYIPGNSAFAGGGGVGAISMREDFYLTFESGDKRVAFGSALFDQWVDLNGEQFYHFRTLPNQEIAGVLSEGVWDNGFGRFGTNRYQLFSGGVVKGDPRFYIKKYMDETSQVKDENGSNPIILRYADVLLLLAEAENEANNGPTALAYEAINQVRQRAGLAVLSPGLDQEEFRTAVRVERRHELYGEFQRRWDLIRWGVWLETMEAANRPRQAYQRLFPISSEEIAANAMINENNPGW